MKNIFLGLTILMASITNLWSQDPDALLINTTNRKTTSLNGAWHYIVDPYENGYYDYRYQPFDQQEKPSRNAYFTNSKPNSPSDLIEYNFDEADTLQVPGDWNTQKEKLYYYEGTIWYKKSFDYTKTDAANRVFVYIGASNYKTEAYLNGKKLGTHIGGFTPFNFEVTDLSKEKDNFLIFKVDNKRSKEGVPTLNTDWWNYGGITRDVKLIETSPTFIQDYVVQLDADDTSLIKGEINLNGPSEENQKVLVEIPELKIKKQVTTDASGTASFEIKSRKIEYWSPENPKLYQVDLTLNGNTLSDRIGFRTITTKNDNILLNGKSIVLKGISLHEESPISKGRANSLEDAKKVLGWIKEMGGNYVRLSHYPHNEHIVKLADEMGILVWEENPVYWTIQWQNESTYANAENQLKELIQRDKNRASVIIWSMANETPVSDARNTFLTRLIETARNLDPTRLISAALEQTSSPDNPNVKIIDDPMADVVDVLSFNQYLGWYGGTPESCRTAEWHIEQNKPVIISEFGAGAKQGYHGDKNTRWTEEYQEYLYEETLAMLKKIPQLRGMSPWILVDFRSPRRPLANIQDDYNRKGLISEDGIKKKAFWTLQNFYSTWE
ncbi:glycoside hydrolase family 2 protein [Flagellimonas zhangzhouensis]|uniref:Beta-glucuronidase n=1 Tax=Flagellimonas zhangzhouensis TaxID=1073328 RepID=A0A1H2WWK5_9FLAO|nr:glycoside hydrolase family 2 TIM barrel-domain containing protein [Allomuricauda zhangzhouensis]SDQ25507.1 beta-glucuronidase [Allomuricauda zhangzhouensis]SDW84888.1 beta-glucuronidase [Allomuricauda zhangzhouensis]